MATFQITGVVPPDEETVGTSHSFNSLSLDPFPSEVVTGAVVAGSEDIRNTFRPMPVVYEGETPVFNPSGMIPGVAYDFSLHGNPFRAVKGLKGNVYYVKKQ